ncbi:hypothetical protein [Lysobacter silvisoli]|uniref:hypothetical protein n=1 Tax=Lysobacter silvisoli TaxID=2293254 RepID=UPI0011C05715|nr:hypothetical protein [Lysobacter silvisoli]
MSAANALDPRSGPELAVPIEDPKGGAQDVRRFSLGQDARSENPGARFDLARELWRSVFLWLLSFDAYQKKVTRPLADGSCCCCF